MGLHQAFPDAWITGVDKDRQPRYPFTFSRGDDLEYIAKHGGTYDFIWASPPCQGHSILKYRTGKSYDDFLPETRSLLESLSVPYIIENVVGAPGDWDVMLCGTMFDLRVYRHRLFEANFSMVQPEHPQHLFGTGSGHGQTQRKSSYEAGNFVTVVGNVGQYPAKAMGIWWMTGTGLSQSIPPSYSKYLAQFIPV